MSAPPACPVLVWGEELEPPKTQGMCGTSLQAGRISDVLCLLWTLCKSASGGTASVFAWLILYFLLLLQELAPLQKQSTVWSWGCLQQWPKSHLLTQHPCESCEWEKVHLQFPFFPPSFPFPKCSFSLLDSVQMLMKAVGVWMQSFPYLTDPKAGLSPSLIWVSKPLIPLEECCI